jgi:hypothetical protein
MVLPRKKKENKEVASEDEVPVEKKKAPMLLLLLGLIFGGDLMTCLKTLGKTLRICFFRLL